MYEDVRAAFDFLQREKHLQPNNVVLYGRSLGSAPTCYLASHSPPAAVILQALCSPHSSTSVGSSLVVDLSERGFIFVVHGQRDWVGMDARCIV
jgi:dienelactone hydrolase